MNGVRFETTIHFRADRYEIREIIHRMGIVLEDQRTLNTITLHTKLENINLVNYAVEEDIFSISRNRYLDNARDTEIVKFHFTMDYTDRYKDEWQWIDHRDVKESIRTFARMMCNTFGMDFFKFDLDESALTPIRERDNVQRESSPYRDGRDEAIRELQRRQRDAMNEARGIFEETKPEKPEPKNEILDREAVIL